MVNTKDTTHIRVSMKVRDFIDAKGKRNETFDDILKRLLKIQ